MLQNQGLEGVWGCFVVCLRPKALVGRFLRGSGAALGRLLAHLGRLLGGSWAVLGARLGRPRVLKAAWMRLGRNFTRKWSQVGIKV